MPVGKEVGHLKGGRLEIQWEIADFLSLPAEVDSVYRSPLYIFGDTSWYIALYPNGEKINSSEGWISVFVRKGDSGPSVTATFCLFLKKNYGREAIDNMYKRNFEIKDSRWGWPKSLKRSELIDRKDEYLPSGSLTVCCTLKLDDEREVKANESTEVCTQTEADSSTERACVQTDIGNEALVPVVQNMKLIRDYKDLILNGDSFDVTLQVKGQKFEAHRTILRARSPVFASMLSHDMKEKNTGLIDIADCDPEYFKDFLLFLYCGSVESITSQNVCSLFKAADKHHVEDLKTECLAFIRSHLDVENFCDVLTLALQHTQADLIKQTTDFFIENALKIFVTVKWQVFLDENPTESNELIIKAFSANKRSNP